MLPDEQCFSIPKIAERWDVSEDTARRQCEPEPGVLRFRRPGFGKRRTVLKVPLSVLQRIEARLAELPPGKRR